MKLIKRIAKDLIDCDEKISESHDKEQAISANKKNNNFLFSKKRYLFLLTAVIVLAIYHIYQDISHYLPPHPIPLIREQYWLKKTKENEKLTIKFSKKNEIIAKKSKNKLKNNRLTITRQPATINQGQFIMTQLKPSDK